MTVFGVSVNDFLSLSIISLFFGTLGVHKVSGVFSTIYFICSYGSSLSNLQRIKTSIKSEVGVNFKLFIFL